MPWVEAHSTGEWGGAVSFATKEEAIAYIVTLAPRGTSLFDIPVVESVDPAADRQGDLGQDEHHSEETAADEGVAPSARRRRQRVDRRRALTSEEVADLIAAAPIACAPWLDGASISAATARDVIERNGHALDDRTAAMRSQH